MPIQAVGFDIDGTLYPASALYLRMLPASLRHLRLLKAFSRVRHELRELNPTLEWHHSNPPDIEKFHRFQAELTARHLGWDAEKAYRVINDFFYDKSAACFDRIPLFPHVFETLDLLRSQGLKLGALSDFPLERKLKLMNLRSRFDTALTSEETGLVKPDRASFDLMAKRLGVRNDQVLYVGNSEAYDVTGARAAGMQTALITRSAKAKSLSKADFVFQDFRDLGTYVLERTQA
ncbi:MAG: HAD family hydrolase [Clostridia bacterium]